MDLSQFVSVKPEIEENDNVISSRSSCFDTDPPYLICQVSFTKDRIAHANLFLNK